MDLTNDFSVGQPVERAWALLTDLERIAPCMPGAQLTGVEGDVYQGRVLVKLGPVTAQYAGTATFERKDDDAHVAVLRAAGRDSRGQGTASALITATLTPDGQRTNVSVHTALTITGKVAQFGRGVILDVSAKLLKQFVDCLETSLVGEADAPADEAASPQPVGTAGAGGATTTTTPVMPAQAARAAAAPPREVAPLDLAAVARTAVLKRAIPLAVLVIVALVLIVWLV